MTIKGSLIDNNSDIQFLKYVIQQRSDPRLLSLSYRNLLQATVTTASLLREEKVRKADEIFRQSLPLLAFVQNAYETDQSLEPRDIGGRKIKNEIVELNETLQGVTKDWLNKMRRVYKIAGFIFIAMYIIGSILLIGSEVLYHHLEYE